MKQILLCSIIIIIFFGSACSKKQVTGILDDISRDTYEKNVREQRIENLGDPKYEEPRRLGVGPSYPIDITHKSV